MTDDGGAEHRASLFQALFDTAVDGMIVIDERGTVRLFNRACETLFGYRPDDVVGRNVRMLMPPPYHAEHDGYLERYRRTGEPRIIGKGREVMGRRKDGSDFPMELSVGESRQGDERLFVGIVRDVTERETTQVRLQQLQAELTHVARLTDMGEMASGLAHELNQPLSAVINYVQAARRMLAATDGQPGERVHEMMDKAVQQASRAGQIIRRLREFIEKGETERAVENINPVIEEASALALTGAAMAGVTVIMDLAQDLPPVVIDRVQIQQVVLNLVRNAVEALAAVDRRELVIRSMAMGKDIEIAIRDTGPGLAPEVSAKLFQPFVTTKQKGMGIGLSICRSIVEAHGGRLSAAHNPGGGTVFTFTLPAAAEAGGGNGC